MHLSRHLQAKPDGLRTKLARVLDREVGLAGYLVSGIGAREDMPGVKITGAKNQELFITMDLEAKRYLVYVLTRQSYEGGRAGMINWVREWTSKIGRYIYNVPDSHLPLPPAKTAKEQLSDHITIEPIEASAACPRCQATGVVSSDMFDGICFACGGSGDALNPIVRAFMGKQWVELTKRNRVRHKHGQPIIGFKVGGQEVRHKA